MEENKNNDEEIILAAKKRFSLGLQAESKHRALAEEDMEFRAGNQWPEEIKKRRELDQRPCLTINKIPGNVHQVTNDQRQNGPAIKVSPADDNADIDTANVMQGMIRCIERNSNSDTAYDIAFDSGVSVGRGYFRIITEYCSPESFYQEARMMSIQDPNNVIIDPSYKEIDGSDANWAFVFEDITREEFKANWPKAMVSQSGFEWQTEDSMVWYNSEDETVRIAEYFVREYKKDVLYRMPDGSSALKSEIDKLSDEEKNALGITEEFLNQTQKRDTKIPIIYWYKMNGNEILERTEFPSRWIPVIPVHGEVLWVKGERILEGIIRHAKDPQRMYNYWATCETESIALAPKAPYIGVEGQFEGHENEWNNAHLKNYAYLQYKSTSLSNGDPAPPPQRNFGEPAVQAITNARMIAGDDLKSTTGIYDASMGNRSNESSGKAINRRVQQSQTNNFHFVDNLSKSIRHAGRILVDIIPKIYDTERMVRILGPDDTEKIVKVNGYFKENNKLKKHDLSIGKYDVSVSIGPSYQSKRQEALDAMLELTASYPELRQSAGDLLIKYMDWDGAQEIADRLRKTINPQLLEDDSDTAIPPQVKAKLDEMGAMVEQLTGQLNDANDQLESKKMELDSKERIEMAKIEKDLRIKEAEIGVKDGAGQEDLAVLANEILELHSRFQELLPQEQNNNLIGEMLPNTGQPQGLPMEEENV